MPATTLKNAPDLKKGYPRSPGAQLGGFVLLPRVIDKCRAVIAGTEGEYKFNCPLDRQFFDFTGVDAELFRSRVAEGASDEEILAWVKEETTQLSEEQILTWSYQQRTRRPQDAETQAYYEKMRLELAPNNPYVETWFQVLDADEGRFQPFKG